MHWKPKEKVTSRITILMAMMISRFQFRTLEWVFIGRSTFGFIPLRPGDIMHFYRLRIKEVNAVAFAMLHSAKK
ncbi:hypothetical protein AB669_09290 [Pedobacter sp. BMA]|nr:hypothetical protein AB669_09290 [Pedobacter sp. BMA]